MSGSVFYLHILFHSSVNTVFIFKAQELCPSYLIVMSVCWLFVLLFFFNRFERLKRDGGTQSKCVSGKQLVSLKTFK